MSGLCHKYSILLICLLSPILAMGQSGEQSPYSAEDVWAPNKNASAGSTYRTGSGHAGPQYWQNHVDYTIEARLDTTARRIRGSVRYVYTNNSPAPLHSVWLITGLASSQKTTYREESSPEAPHIGIDNLSVGNEEEKARSITSHSAGSRLELRLNRPIEAQGGTLTFELDYEVPIRSKALPALNSGSDGILYEMAYWYPRVAVYSQQRGWAEVPARAPGEALSEYGSFEYSLTVPADLIVAGSGTLMNPNDVLTSDQRRRLMRARDSHEKVAIITPDQAGSPDIRPQQSGFLTWTFKMNGTRDVAWAASPSFIWNAARIDRRERRDGLAMSFYPPSSMGGEAWNRSTYHTQKATEFFSERFYTYPWNTTTNVAGTVGKQGFPGLSFCPATYSGSPLFSCTVQNVSANWFPIMVGSNQERHPWMDDGLSTLLSILAHRTLYDGEFYPKRDASYAPGKDDPAEGLRPLMKSRDAAPITTSPSLQSPDRRSALSAYKPAYGLLLLREYVLSPNRFDHALAQYADRWSFRHPTPDDFFRTMSDASGTDLGWFWTTWFKHAWAIDQAVDSVTYKENNPEQGAVITLSLHRKMPMPVKATVTEVDGDTHRVRLPVDVWKQGSSHTTHVNTDDRVQSVQLDPNERLPDVNPANDTWQPETSADTTGHSPYPDGR